MTENKHEEIMNIDTQISREELNNENYCNDFFTTISAQRHHYMKEVARIQNNKNTQACNIGDKPSKLQK